MGHVTLTTAREEVCHPKLTLDIFYLHTKFSNYHFSRSVDMIAGIETDNGSCDPEYAPFRGGLSFNLVTLASAVPSDLTTPLSGMVCHPLAIALTTIKLSIKFKSLSPPTAKIRKGIQNVKNGMDLGS